MYSLSRITFPCQCSPLEHQLISASSLSAARRRELTAETSVRLKPSDDSLTRPPSNRRRGFILRHQALCSLWSPNLRHLKAESSSRPVSAPNHLTPPPTSTPSSQSLRFCSSGVRDAVLDLVYPQLSAGRV